MLARSSITRVLGIVAGGGLVLMLAMSVLVTLLMRQNLIEMKRKEISHTVEGAAAIVKKAFDAARAAGQEPKTAIRAAAEMLRSARFDGGNYLYVFDVTGTAVMHPIRVDLEGKDILGLRDSQGMLFVQAFNRVVNEQKAGFTEYHWTKPGHDAESRKIAYNIGIEGSTAYVGSGLHLDDVDASVRESVRSLAGVLVPLVLVYLVAVLLLGRKLARALGMLRCGVEGISAGRLDTSIEGTERADEIGLVARALLVFRDALALKQASEARENEARERENARAAAISGSLARFEGIADTVVLTISSAAAELEAASNALAGSAHNTMEEVSNVSSAATRTNEGFHGLASAGEMLSASASEISNILGHCSQASRDAVTNVRGTDEHARALEGAAAHIGKVLGLINGLAEQTNLLALNATIEAARAGDAGKGFAVVASEVKVLAGRTGSATGEISDMIQQIQSATCFTVKAIKEIDGSIDKIARATEEIGGSVDEQVEATRNIAENVRQAVESTDHVSEAISHVSHSAQDTAAAASQVHSAAAELSRQADVMRREVHDFLASVRAA